MVVICTRMESFLSWPPWEEARQNPEHGRCTCQGLLNKNMWIQSDSFPIKARHWKLAYSGKKSATCFRFPQLWENKPSPPRGDDWKHLLLSSSGWLGTVHSKTVFRQYFPKPCFSQEAPRRRFRCSRCTYWFYCERNEFVGIPGRDTKLRFQRMQHLFFHGTVQIPINGRLLISLLI